MDIEEIKEIKRIEQISKQIVKVLDSIELCFKNEMELSTLILIYSTIDSMAYLSKSIQRDKVNKWDFKKWTEKYLIKHLDCNCTGLDLYGARCGILHSFKADSDLSNKNEVKTIQYSWGKTEHNLLKQIANSRFIPLNINNFIEALKIAVNEFFEEIFDDVEMMSRFENNSKNYFVSIKV